MGNNSDIETKGLVSDSPIRIITDEPSNDASDFKKYANQLSKLIVNSKPRFTVGIYGGWGTGKTTLMEMIKRELDENYPDNVETVWFDSWRYEREEYSAMVPLLRTIILSINDRLQRIRNSSSNDKKQQVLTKLRDSFTKVGNAIIRNTTANLGLKAGDILEAGATFDINKMIDDYRSDGSFINGQERVYFRKHISEHLKEELQNIRHDTKGDLIYDYRLIIFIDDLDRCTPERALELLESIKTFFDIEGILYVIGIDPKTIDPIVKTKYGENSKINGMDYLQKIVQLPFRIPVWSEVDISKTIREMISKTGLPESDINEILNDMNVELIVRAAQLNPRDVKRFINIIILSRYIYEQSIGDIAKLIAVQAFYFRGDKWLDFLKLISSYDDRTVFLKYLIILLEGKARDVSNVTDLSKIITDIQKEEENFRLPPKFLEIFKKLELNDNDLFDFLKSSAATLLRIDRMDKYLRVVETSGMFEDVSISLGFGFGREKQLQLLKDGKVTEFNEHNRLSYPKSFGYSHFHAPFEDLSALTLDGIYLSRAFLFHVGLTGANLSRANLSRADLTGAYLNVAHLTGADLTGADLTGADLRGADLTGADLRGIDLTGADLTGANLTKANLTKANLLEIDHFEDLMIYETEFKDAIIDNSKFIEYSSKTSARNIPEAVTDKTELRKRLGDFGMPEHEIRDALKRSKLR